MTFLLRGRVQARPRRGWLLAAIFLLWLLLPMARAADPAAPPLIVDSRSVIDLWPHVRVVAEPPGPAWRWDEALQRSAQLAPPATVRDNFGPRDVGVWVQVPLQVDGDRPVDRVLTSDYALIARIDAFIVRDGRLLLHERTGTALARSERSQEGAAQILPLQLPSGASQLWLRLESRTTIVAPLRLRTPQEAAAHWAGTQLLYGLYGGLMLCLLIYTLVHAVSLRDSIFGYYAVFLLGNLVLIAQYSGLGPLYLWPEQLAWSKMAAQAGLLLTITTTPFMRRMMDVRAISVWADRVLWATANLATGSLVLMLVGWMDAATSVLLSKILGLATLAAIVPVAFVRTRRGEQEAYFMLAGWVAFSIGGCAFASFSSGLISPSLWVVALYPLSTTIEASAWVCMLGLRVQKIHRQAERARAETDALQALARTDALTGLHNRRGLQQVLEEKLPSAGPGRLLALYLLDLDGFKPVNDRYGHDTGDALLIAVGQRLKGRVRQGDLVARLGGDEFVVLAMGVADSEGADTLGKALVDRLSEPFDVLGQRCVIGATIGYALAPLDGRSAAELLKRADVAMYAGKRSGRGRLQRGGIGAIATREAAPVE